ncbi:MAG: helix-turn-helix domain-containing protein [Bacteroidota bacterium]
MNLNAVILSQEQFDELAENLKTINEKLQQLKQPNHDELIPNQKLGKMLNVSDRTLQNWRDEGLIAFTQIGKKIYYTKADLEAFIERHKKNAFAIKD